MGLIKNLKARRAAKKAARLAPPTPQSDAVTKQQVERVSALPVNDPYPAPRPRHVEPAIASRAPSIAEEARARR
jgi:hypothetical protein